MEINIIRNPSSKYILYFFNELGSTLNSILFFISPINANDLSKLLDNIELVVEDIEFI